MTRSQKHFGELKRIHLIGIGGSGMIGLAMVLQKKGFNISGSDLQMTEELSSLKALGAKVQLGHDPRYIKSSDVVVASSAIAKNNAELKYAKKITLPSFQERSCWQVFCMAIEQLLCLVVMEKLQPQV